MPVDATPISQIPDSFSVSNAVGKAITLKDMANRTQLDQLLVSREKEQQDQDKAVNKVLSKHDLATDAGLNDAVHDLAKSGYGRQSVALRREAQSDAIRDAQLTNERDQHIVNSAKFKMDLVSPILEQAGARIRKYQEAKMSPVDMNRAIGPDMMNQVYELANKKGLDGQPIMSPQEVQEAEAAFQQGSVVDYVQTHISAMPQARKAIDDAQAAMDKHTHTKIEEQQGWARIAKEGEKVETIKVGGKPHRILFDSEGNKKRDLGETTEPASTAAAAKLDTDKNKALLAALAAHNVSLPAGFRSAAQQAATLDGLWARAYSKNPNATEEDIAADLKSGVLKMVTAKAEAGIVGKREGNIASAQLALVQPGGIYDQLMSAARNVDFGDVNIQNSIRTGLAKHVYSSPEIQAYVTKLEEARADLGNVLSRSGQITDQSRAMAAQALPEVQSVDALQSAVTASTEVANSIIEGNETVEKALSEGKPLSEVIKASRQGKGATAGSSSNIDALVRKYSGGSAKP